jgi:hypothetical protein
LYTLVASNETESRPVPVSAVATEPAPTPHSAPAAQNSPAPPHEAATGGPREKTEEKVKCNFTSTPSGAEITLDGKYVGSTPSEIALNAGTHAVVFSMPGFVEWKRDLTVSAGSELTVSGILQKQP